MRLFIAIDVSMEVDNLLRELQKSLSVDYARIAFTPSFHLTLNFLGNVPDDRVSEIKRRVSKICFNRFSITLDKFGVFPNEKYINVVWIGVRDNEEINKLQKAVEDSLIGMFPRERFHAHITLGRIKSLRDKAGFISLIKSLHVIPLSFSADKFRLYESILRMDGPEYRIIEEFDLKIS